MRIAKNVYPMIVLLLTSAAGSLVLADHSAPPTPAIQAPEVKTATGELTKVDTENKTFTIKQENDEEIVFQYDENVKVEGRENGVQGLATETGIQVTVYYVEEDGKRLVNKIEIKKSDG
ncbi:MAG TPA: hypothetical protein VE398_05555 [Acidobacteriota bacterium]|nr:hypothetical protein [Acidobacteriota bacterium]